MFCEFDHKIFDIDAAGFVASALEIFRFQYRENQLYRAYLDTLHTQQDDIQLVNRIPFLPISFFKSDVLKSGQFEPEVIFESSGTTGQERSRHYVKDASLYRESFMRAFRLFYGDPRNYCILGLLPSYLERKHASLVYMVDALIKESGHPSAGFFLHDHDGLARRLHDMELRGQQSLLLGVTFALLDFAEAHPMPLQHSIIMETGGMKGRKEELTREEVHQRLKQAFSVKVVHSEYGMTELLSQAYAGANGRFVCPPWMRVLIREEDDPFEVYDAAAIPAWEYRQGLINIVDLANIYSCSFIATDDIGRLYADGSFEVLGRADKSELRGCSMMVTENVEP